MDPSGSLEWYDFGAGWFSGICGLLVGYPADTVKVQQQTLGNRGAFTVAVSLLKNQGVLAFYKGLMMPLVSAGVINAVFFGCYGNTVHQLAYMRGEKPLKSCCSNENNKPAYAGFHWDILNAGCVAGFITTLVACPFELVKVKLQTQADHLRKCTKTHCDIPYTGTFDCLTKLFKAGGFRFIYRGLVPMLWRDVPTYGLYILVYEHTLCLCETNTKNTSAPVVCILTSGALAGVAAWVGVMPIDVVKSRIQADDSEHPRFKGTIDCFRQTYRKHGSAFFMRGFVVTMARAGPVNAATFAGYEAYLYLYFKLKNQLGS